jgi:hypothetical protein
LPLAARQSRRQLPDRLGLVAHGLVGAVEAEHGGNRREGCIATVPRFGRLEDLDYKTR